MKTSKSASKRIKVSGSGKLLRAKMSAQHRRIGKSKRAKREARSLVPVAKGDLRKLRVLVPYAN